MWRSLETLCHGDVTCSLRAPSGISFAAVNIVAAATFLAFVFSGGTLNAEIIFTTISLFSVLQLSFTKILPLGVQSAAEMVVALRRFEEMLTLPEVRLRPRAVLCTTADAAVADRAASTAVAAGIASSSATLRGDSSVVAVPAPLSIAAVSVAVTATTTTSSASGSGSSTSTPASGPDTAAGGSVDDGGGITVRNIECSWGRRGAKFVASGSRRKLHAAASRRLIVEQSNSNLIAARQSFAAAATPAPLVDAAAGSTGAPDATESATLFGISMRVPTGSLCAVVGEVGCGKTSLLMALLGELRAHRGEVLVRGRVAYVPQDPWIVSGTVRDNIVLNQPFDPVRYQRVIEHCCLQPDFDALDDGDSTQIVFAVLSGGQKSRISLARAAYADADVYLLDDPLSAVDARVGRALFERCVCGLLADKTRVLVTHQLQFLKPVSNIVVLSYGTVVAQGSYAVRPPLLSCRVSLLRRACARLLPTSCGRCACGRSSLFLAGRCIRCTVLLWRRRRTTAMLATPPTPATSPSLRAVPSAPCQSSSRPSRCRCSW